MRIKHKNKAEYGAIEGRGLCGELCSYAEVRGGLPLVTQSEAGGDVRAPESHSPIQKLTHALSIDVILLPIRKQNVRSGAFP